MSEPLGVIPGDGWFVAHVWEDSTQESGYVVEFNRLIAWGIDGRNMPGLEDLTGVYFDGQEVLLVENNTAIELDTDELFGFYGYYHISEMPSFAELEKNIREVMGAQYERIGWNTHEG